ncbi:MAG: hypothetical protein M1814_003804 [Vezdaea aestivalis]|nr:MAG: hypothetical protein M1814_003804 [Vezdaea aestivalis]
MSKLSVPYRQIRALYDDETITVYQAYSRSIGEAAVEQQKLSASPNFSSNRTTWIKPSWCWMMYRAGYSFKDPNQACILAIKMKHAHFHEMLSEAVVLGGGHSLTDEERKMGVRIQWDPERSPRIGQLQYRSIQIGITGALNKKWVDNWIYGIEDMTDKAIRLYKAVEGDEGMSWAKVIESGLMPVEREYIVSVELQKQLKMDANEEESQEQRKKCQKHKKNIEGAENK